MGEKRQIRQKKKRNPQATSPGLQKGQSRQVLLPWILLIVATTLICFSPMLKNGFTNWDDEYYVIQNSLLSGPDWSGIFSKPVASNYHPLTILTLAFNYALTGFDPLSYLILNLILHLINTILVFYFIWTISGKKMLVAAFTSLIFGIHPMHVESVAWVSERKDVLYTLFFLLSLIQYWFYLISGRKKNLFYCFLFFVLSLLSKPAAIILPLVLVLLDYWYGRRLNKKIVLEKSVFFLLSVLFIIITLSVQSETAVAGLDTYPLWTRFFFGAYAIMIYFFRFFIPYPLSAFHPFPPPYDLGLAVFISPVFVIILAALIWYFRKQKALVFSVLFFVINLLLVSQVITIGSTLISERYTYVPYIGIAFGLGVLLDKYFNSPQRLPALSVGVALLIAYGFLTFQRTKVWQNSDTLWTDVLKTYPNSPSPLSSRANYYIQLVNNQPGEDERNELLRKALDDCNEALKTNPDFARAYENRQGIYLAMNRFQEALNDANVYISLKPESKIGYYTKAAIYENSNLFDSALTYYNKVISIDPGASNILNYRGLLLFNHYHRYTEAIGDFTSAIQISPQGDYYLNRSYCYFNLGNIAQARADALIAMQKGVVISTDYRQRLNI